MEVTVIPVVIGALGTITKSLVAGVGNRRMSGDHPNYNIVEVGKNPEKNFGVLRRLSVT